MFQQKIRFFLNKYRKPFLKIFFGTVQKLKKNLQQMGLKLFFFKLGTSKYYCLFFISTTNFTRATPGFIQITFYLIFFTIYYFYVIKIEIKIELESSKFYNFFYYLKYVWDYPKYIFLQMRNE